MATAHAGPIYLDRAQMQHALLLTRQDDFLLFGAIELLGVVFTSEVVSTRLLHIIMSSDDT
jgi:hypothetical protein